jgi:hypothetical protein
MIFVNISGTWCVVIIYIILTIKYISVSFHFSLCDCIPPITFKHSQCFCPYVYNIIYPLLDENNTIFFKYLWHTYFESVCVELYLHYPNTPPWLGAQLKNTRTTLPLPCKSDIAMLNPFVMGDVKQN